MNKVNYLQFPLSAFLKMYPSIVALLPPGLDISDPDYFVRVDSSGRVEFGYLSDNWVLS